MCRISTPFICLKPKSKKRKKLMLCHMPILNMLNHMLNHSHIHMDITMVTPNMLVIHIPAIQNIHHILLTQLHIQLILQHTLLHTLPHTLLHTLLHTLPHTAHMFHMLSMLHIPHTTRHMHQAMLHKCHMLQDMVCCPVLLTSLTVSIGE